MTKWCLNYESGDYEYIEQDGFSVDRGEYVYNWDDSEYRRDLDKGLPIDMPKNYYPDNDPSKTPVVNWRSCANLLYSNWLNYFVYQATPYDIMKIKDQEKD